MKPYTPLTQLLERYRPLASEEAIAKARMQSFLEAHPNAFERSCMPGHFTASAWLLDKTGTRALLMHHRKMDIWVQLGGHCDGDPDVLGVALREAREESGIDPIVAVSSAIFDLDIHLIPEYQSVPAHEHYDLRFLLQVQGEGDFVPNEESKALQWIDADRTKLPSQHPSLLRLFNKWQRWLRQGQFAPQRRVVLETV